MARSGKAPKAANIEVGRVARDALANGRSMNKAVAAAFGYTAEGARTAIQRARAAGLVPYKNRGWDGTPPKERKPKSAPIARLRLVCSCGATFRLDQALDLQRHCLEDHHRHARTIERTPQPVERAA